MHLSGAYARICNHRGDGRAETTTRPAAARAGTGSSLRGGIVSWTTKAKDLGIANTQGHTILQPGLLGRGPGVAGITFAPLELFGAMARCHYTHLINPHAVTWEVQHMASLLEQHVDDYTHPFDILSSADTMKDYVKSYFVGTVAAGIAYLVMVNDGYVWSDHWENLAGGAPGVTKSPDFVFSSPTHGTALMESKGTRSATTSAFNTTVSNGYDQQVEPHLGQWIGGAQATHGYSIGAHLTTATQASLNIHHTAVPASAAGGGAAGGSPTSVQRQSFATAFTLAHGPSLGQQIREGRAQQPFVFFRFAWAGRTWVTKSWPGSGVTLGPDPGGRWLLGGPRPQQDFTFAIQEDRAAQALGLFLAASGETRFPGDRDADFGEFIAYDKGMSRVRSERGEGLEGVIFPDGLAVLGDVIVPRMEPVFWDGYSGNFQPIIGGAWRARF